MSAYAPPTESETPVDQPDELAPQDPMNKDLPEDEINLLRACIQEFEKQEQYDRRLEVLRDRRNRYYERGFQQIIANREGCYMGISPGGVYSAENGDSVQAPTKCDSYNIFGPTVRTIEAVLTQNPPGIDFRPDKLDRPEDVEAAENGETYRIIFNHNNDVKSIQTKTVRFMCVSGRTIYWVYTTTDVQKFGRNADGSPKHVETCKVYGTIESKVPITATCLSECHVINLRDDPDVKTARWEYPDFADKIKPGMAGMGEGSYERLARLGVLQGNRYYSQSGEVGSHLVTRTHSFGRPSAWAKYGDDSEEKSVADRLTQRFPDGCHSIWIGDVFVGAEAKSMDDCLVIGFPQEGDGMSRPAIIDPAIVIQDQFNNCMNAASEVFDYGWPSRWVSCSPDEYDAITSQVADPYAYRLLKATPGEPVANNVYQEPDPNLPSTFQPYVDNMAGQLLQFMTATPPAIFGGQMGDAGKTASGYMQAKSQAMGQQGIWWASIQSMMAQMYYLAAIAATTNPDYDDTIVVPGQQGTNQTVRLDKITKGKFGAFPDEDSSFPESTTQKRTVLQGIVEMAAQSPLGEQLFTSPDNIKVMLTVMGFPELVLPEAEARDKQKFEIEQLLAGAPIPADPAILQQAMIQHAKMAGMAAVQGQPEPPFQPPPQFKSSVPVVDSDYNEWEAEECKEWLSSDARRREDAKGNMQGVQNVYWHWKEHMQLAIAMAPPPMAAPAPAKGIPSPPKKPGSNVHEPTI